ncbi:MAG: hypothetical protein JO215_08480 [Ktedonobacteraceae bacterium]|nr:hypothetical protein [Ktedonobacteraceae bacterium]
MKNQLRPMTIEQMALFAEKAGQLAATVIRTSPESARALGFALFETVMMSFSHAPNVEDLRETKIYDEFEMAWRAALKNTMRDLEFAYSEKDPNPKEASTEKP